MNKLLFLIISIFPLIIFGCATTPEVKLHESPDPISRWGGVNKEQPISIGEMIYTSGKGTQLFEEYVTSTVFYRFMGVDDKNNIKVIYKLEYDPYGGPPKVETFSLLLPLNPKKQTILKVISYEIPHTVVSKKELLITVVDEFNRITVEEIGKTQTK
ncbi:MAG: hypothetical protein AB1638_11215 [Nitrospirota bacterium]